MDDYYPDTILVSEDNWIYPQEKWRILASRELTGFNLVETPVPNQTGWRWVPHCSWTDPAATPVADLTSYRIYMALHHNVRFKQVLLHRTMAEAIRNNTEFFQKLQLAWPQGVFDTYAGRFYISTVNGICDGLTALMAMQVSIIS